MNNQNGPTMEQRAEGLNALMTSVYGISQALEFSHGQTITAFVAFDDEGKSVMAKRVPAEEMIQMLESAIKKLRDEGDDGWHDESEPVTADQYEEAEK